ALDPVVEYFEKLVASLEPTPIHLHGIDVFEADRVVFTHVEPNDTLERYRQRVLADLAERFKVKARDVEGDEYRFHATIAYNLTPEQFPLAREALADTTVELRFTMSKLALFYYTGDTWIAFRRRRLARALP